MKRIVAMLLTMMMLFGIVGFATADTDSTLPEDIVKQLDKNDVVLSSVQLGTSDGVCWFIIVRTWENKNVLYMFKQFNGSVFYRLLAKNEKILPDSTSLSLTLRNAETDPWVGDEFVGPVLDIDIINNTGDTTFRLVFQMNGAEDWNLIRVWDVANQYMSAEFDATRIYQFYDYRSKNVKRSAEWRYPRNLKDAVLSDLLNENQYRPEPTVTPKPHAYSETPIDMPYSEQIIPDNGVEFPANKRHAVYSGPSETALRGANNKAVVSTNDWIQVFGREGNWALVNYGIGKNHYRFGYISADALPKGYQARTLQWLNISCTMLKDAIVTDDPFYSQSELTRVTAGTQVIWLGTIGDWAYIECSNFRGFVLLAALGVMDG